MQIVPCFWESGPFCLGWLLEKLAFPLSIAYAVYRLALYQIEKTRLANLTQLDRKRQIDFADKQLSEFYAPMVGARAEIFNQRKFETYVYRAAAWVDEEWAKHDQKGKGGEVTAAYDARNKVSAENERVKEERLNAYIKMRELFARKMAYADSDTRAWYDYFYAVVEMLRALDKADGRDLDPDVRVALATMLEVRPLEPFYAHLQERTNQLQREIQGLSYEKTPAPAPPDVGEPFIFVPDKGKRTR